MHPIKDCEEYYRVIGYIPLLESILEDLKTRFSNDLLNVLKVPSVFPSQITELSQEELICTAKDISEEFAVMLKINFDILFARLQAEMLHWQQKWNSQSFLPEEGIEILKACDADVFPSINKILQVCLTLPVSNASAERSFSSLRRLKTWLRSTMTENRLNGLALLHIHKENSINPYEVLEKFISLGKHKLIL